MKQLAVRASILLCFPFLSLAQTPDTDFRIVLTHSDSDPSLIVALVTTTATYPCFGYRLQTRVAQSHDTLTISIGGLVRPSSCFHAFDIARGDANLGSLSPGKYMLCVAYRNVVDHFEIRVAQKRILIQPIKHDFSEVTSQ